VTGVLPTALDKATRVVQTLLKTGKEYVGVMHVHKDIPEEQLRNVINEFIGKINQLPPVKSAVKRQIRQREVYYLEILEIKGKDVLFRTGVEAGTYIRKLCSDIGEKIGGAHMAELRRTKVGPFDESTIISLQDLTDAYWFWKNEGKEGYIRYCVRPIEFALGHMAKLWVFDNTVDAICNGIDLKIPGISKLSSGINKDDMVAVMSLKGELIGLGDAKMDSEQIMKEKKGIAVKVHKVFMNPGTYPRIKKEE
jgi:H/ACA ribonucleoprotein complex subunit 4